MALLLAVEQVIRYPDHVTQHLFQLGEGLLSL